MRSRRGRRREKYVNGQRKRKYLTLISKGRRQRKKDNKEQEKINQEEEGA